MLILYKVAKLSWVGWHMCVAPKLERLEGGISGKFQAGLGYTVRLCLKKNNQQTNKKHRCFPKSVLEQQVEWEQFKGHDIHSLVGHRGHLLTHRSQGVN